MKCKSKLPIEAKYCLFCGQDQDKKSSKKKRGNGQGSVFKLKNGKYRAEVVKGYYHEDGKLKKWTIARSYDKKKDAVEALTMLKNMDRQTKLPTVYELYQNFTSSRKYDKLSKSQKDKLKYAWNRMKKIHYKTIDTLQLPDMQRVIDETTSTYYPAKDMKVLFSHLFTLAIKLEKATLNRAQYIELPEQPSAKRQVFDETEIAKFWDDYNGQNPEGCAEPHEFTGYILIMIYTGMRIGELYGILKENVYLDEQYMIGGEKTEAGKDREIPISDVILPIVNHFYKKGKSKLIHMGLDKFYEIYKETIQRLEVRDYPPHTCRHTYFTLLAQNGVHPSIIAAVGGHAQYETAIDHYNRISVKEKLKAVNKI